MIWTAYSTYHNEYYWKLFSTKLQARQAYSAALEITAENIAENEVEEDWQQYYATYNEAFSATFNGILETLKSETEYRAFPDEKTALQEINRSAC